ncbi:MAG: cysteine hydrolase [Defluviitaleaceae bacterium]|nr:cysteine hydrolase [Defluviitaleaceae bacterium]
MATKDEIRSTQHLRKDHAEFELVGKPALCLNHMQLGLAGEGMFLPNWGPNAKEGIKNSGMVEKCKMLIDAFHEKKLPVIFCNVVPIPLPYANAYGDMFREQKAAYLKRYDGKFVDYFTDEWTRRGLQVMPELGPAEQDFVSYSWNVHPFTNSGLELLLHQLKVDTVVWTGFAQQSVVLTSCAVAADKYFNSIVPVDASYCCVPPSTPEFYEGLDEIVAEAVVKVMLAALAQCTDAAAVIDKIKRYEEPRLMPDPEKLPYID